MNSRPTEEILKSVVEDYKKIENSNEELLEKCSKIRQSLIIIIKQQLVNSDEIILEIQKAKNQSSETETVLNFFHYLIDGFPHPVFVPSMEQWRSLQQNSEDENYMKIYSDFLFLLVSRLIQLITFKELDVLHDTSNNTLNLLIQLIKMQNVKVYQLLIRELINLYTELYGIKTKHYLTCANNISGKVKLQSFHLALPEHKDIAELVISSFEYLESWQIVCSKILQMLVPDICLLAFQKFELLLLASLDQIIYGQFPLKIASTKLCSHLICGGNYLSEKVLQSLMTCVMPLVEVMALDRMKSKYLNTGLSEGVISSCHQSFMQFLIDIFVIIYPETSITYLNIPKPQLSLDFYHLNMLTSQLSSNIGIAPNCDQKMFKFCNFAVLGAFQLVTSDSRSKNNVFAASILNITQSLLINHATPLLIELLTNLYAFLCLTQTQLAPLKSFADSTVSPGKLTKRLSRKRLHDSDDTRKEIEDDKGFVFTQLCVQIHQRSQLILTEFQQLLEKFNLKNEPLQIVLNNLKTSSTNLVMLFEPFLNSLVFLKNNELCKKLLVASFDKSMFASIFCKYVETCLVFLSQNQATVQQFEVGLLFDIYGSIIKLAKLLSLWYHVCEEMNIPLCQEDKKVLSIVLVLLSCVWLEDLPWKDLKVGFLSFLSKSALLSFCYSLKLSSLCEKHTASFTDGQNVLILSDCLQGLALLPQSVAPMWRHSVLLQWTLSSGLDDVETSVFSFIPIFCSKLNSSNVNPVMIDLLTYIKNKETISSKTQLVKRLIELLSPLALIMTNNYSVTTNLFSDGTDSSHCLRLKSQLVAKDQNECSAIEDENLALISEIAKVSLAHLNSYETPTQTEVWRSMCVNLIHGLNSVLQCVNKRKNVSQKLLVQFIQCFHWSVNFKRFEPHFVAEDDDQWNEHIFEKIEETLKDSFQENNITTACNLAFVVGAMLDFCVKQNQCESTVFHKSLQMLCKLFCSSQTKVSSMAYVELEKFATKHKQILENNRKTVSGSLIGVLLENEGSCGIVQRVFEDAALIFTTSLNGFVDNNVLYLLPPLISKQSSKSKETTNELLELLSSCLNCSKSDLIKRNFKHIFCYAVTTGSDVATLFEYLENETKIKKESLLLMTHGSLIQHLLAHVSISSERVCNALQFMHQVKSSDESVLPISELLKPHFLSVLTFFNSQLRLPSVTLVDKLQVYESLIHLLYLLDTGYITTVFVKIVNTLCLAQQVFINSSKSTICCKAWHALVCCVDNTCLGTLLSQVVVMLLPCLEKVPNEVSKTLEFMIIEKHQYTKDDFAELYFLPDHNSLKKVKSHIDKEVHCSKSSSTAFLHALEQATKHLSHDSAEVRLCALNQVRMVLRSNQKSLLRQCLITGRVSDLVQSLISALLTCCRDANPQIKLLSAKCLGEMGAIDPDKISFVVSNNKPKRQTHNSFDDGDFAYDLFNCLVQAFLVAKPSHQDISAFAIQELLKIYKCQDGHRATSGRKLWRKFSEQIQAVLEPHLSSRYLLKKSEINIATLKRPILHRKQNMTFRDWIGTFCAVLMRMASSIIDSSSVVGGVFGACAAVVRSDVDVAFFLLPPTIVEVLKCGDEHLDFITEEIMTVLESTELLQGAKKSVNSDDYSSSLSRGDEDVAPKQANNFPVHTSHLSQLSAQAVFAVLDHVTLWLQKTTAAHAGGAASRTKLAKEKEQASKFLSMIPQKTLATASLHCRDYPRALLHYETYLREQPVNQLETESAAFLQRVFIEMNETDGVLGVVNVRGVEPSLETRLLVLESTGALQDASACYERIICHNPTDMCHYKGFFKCLIDLGQLSEAVNLIEGTITNNPTWKNDLTSYGVEACWRLGKWDMLEKKVSSISSVQPKSWSVGIGEAILAIREKDWKKLENILDRLYQSQTDPLSVASMETNSFQRGYDHILRLHTLSDLERFSNVIREQSESSTIDDVMSLWLLRLQVVQPSFRACDPVLTLGRVLLPLISNVTGSVSDCDSYVGKLWLRSCKSARKCGLLQTAYGALLSAQRYQLPGYCIEHAKWLWKKGESHQALLTLQRGFAEHYASNSGSKSTEQRLERAKVMLLEAKLMEESSSYDPNVVLRKYKEVVSYMGDWEDSHFYCGRYYDKLMTSMMGENRATAKSQHLYYIMSHYGRSLCFGTSHIYESLTKLLTLWLDYGETAAKLEKAGRPQSVDDVQRLVQVIADVRSRLPAYIFYVAFSQLTSRICHQHEPTYGQLKEILISVILAFPQRALWSMIAISKSSFKQRANRCQEIFERVRYKEPKLAKLITDVITLTNRLLELCNKPVSNIQPLSMATHFKQLKKLVEGNNFSEIILPLQKFMNVVLPQSKQTSVLGSQTTHNPFPEATTHIVGFDDTVEILSSLQRPKKISIRASDGQPYAFLCKPKDDLRKDARLTEFAAIVNKCLYRDPESGKRHLRIRTYAVIPLNEECGLIEWVENMKGLRHILLPIYKSKSLYCSGKQLKAWQLPVATALQKKLEVFRTKFLPRHPPVFHEWFLTTFPDPSSWYNARLAYARSVAVMSMVGYMLGLGDRHGENILFDSNNGEAMHVDFNCLFNKGLSLEVPEIVPFRLTHNMVDAMGPTKYEGFFRKACEVTMNVLREQREPLMSVLKTFIYDPLVEWSKKSRGNGTSTSGEVLTEKALSHVNDIDKRLRGIVGKNKGLPLSSEGHVHYLIQEATDEEKLCQMYIGWAPFM